MRKFFYYVVIGITTLSVFVGCGNNANVDEREEERADVIEEIVLDEQDEKESLDASEDLTEKEDVIEKENVNEENEIVEKDDAVEEKLAPDILTDEQALDAIKRYCYINNPDLENIVNEGQYQVYWDISLSNDDEIVVLFVSYTGAEVRYYIDRATGDTYVTEFVLGILDEEELTDERFNVWDY